MLVLSVQRELSSMVLPVTVSILQGALPGLLKVVIKRWLPNAAAYISCFLTPVSEVYGSATVILMLTSINRTYLFSCTNVRVNGHGLETSIAKLGNKMFPFFLYLSFYSIIVNDDFFCKNNLTCPCK